MSRALRSTVLQRKSTALLLIDVVNNFNFPDGTMIYHEAVKIAKPLQALKRRAHAAGVPVIYVNDNFGAWRSDRRELLQKCLRRTSRGRDFVQKLKPGARDYFVLKPMHSAFYQTPLDKLVQILEVKTLILTGLTSNSCITSTAHEANMRGLELLVPEDCSSAKTAEEHKAAMEHLQTALSANTVASQYLQFR